MANIDVTPVNDRLPLDTRNACSIESTSNRMPQVPFESLIPAVAAAVWLIVTLVVAVPEAGSDTCAGLKLHVMPSGSPTQAKLTCPVNAETEETVKSRDVIPHEGPGADDLIRWRLTYLKK